ncbi:hypothetical protein MC885_019418 [Smutsia gigantea]|nr:hypothetical protein MC885_019418 [Smutsia gigantea]
MEPSEMTNGCFLSVLTRERDPSEAVSVKDVLARAAAKGLLDGTELGKSSKREKKKKKSKLSSTKAPPTDSNGIPMKIAQFLNREANANANQSETLTVKTSLSQKNTTQVGSSSQVRKPSKPATSPLAPTVAKNTSSSRPYERPTNFLRPRPEDRMIALKPVQIVLPPVMLPFSSPHGIRPQLPPQQFYYRWVGAKTTAPSYLPTPAISRRGEKPKENLPFSLLRHPQP